MFIERLINTGLVSTEGATALQYQDDALLARLF